jgi:hypothetical protein
MTADGTAYITTPVWRPDRIWDTRHVKEYRADELEALLAPHFGTIEMAFAWPRFWSDLYRTRIGWRALKYAGRLGVNPFTRESGDSAGYCQMLAVCRQPRQGRAH